MPLIRRLPKRGFNNPFYNVRQIVNVESLNQFKENTTVGPKEMKAAGLIGSERERVKVLGGGALTKALVVKAHEISASAKKKLADAGATIELLNA